MSTVSAFAWRALTAAVLNIKSPNTALQNMLFSRHITRSTETIELGLITGGREIAPFVRSQAEGILVGGLSKSFAQVAGPNIRIKRAFGADVLFDRQPGTPIHLVGNETQESAVEQAIARDLQYMVDIITNTKEYLCARILQGSIAITLADGEVMTITVPRAAANSIILGTFWDSSVAAFFSNLHTVKEVMNDAEGLPVTDAICGAEAAHTILAQVEAGNLKPLNALNRITAGQATFESQFDSQGMIYIGTFSNIRFWQYSRSALLNGVDTAMIRSKWIEFVNANNSQGASDRVMEFAGIPDIEAFESGRLKSEMFAKSWVQKDPSARIALLHSRPLPWARKPNATVSMKVVSG